MDPALTEVIWIEVLARQREAVARQRVSGAVITLGRAYDNDLVLDDPHVAPHHLRLQRDADGRWSADDLGSRNGTFVAGKRHDHAVLSGDTVLQIGQTGIRLRSSAQAVPPELPLLRAQPRWPWALVCLAGLLGWLVLQTWLDQTGEVKFYPYLSQVLGVSVAVVAWAAVWSVLARIFTGWARYGLHLLIASAGLLVMALYEPLSQMAAFALALPVLTAYGFVATWLILAAVCYGHLRAFSPARRIVKAVCMVLLAALAITVQILGLSDIRSRSNQPTTALLEKLQPPALRLVPPQTPTAFFAAATSLKPTLDQARTKDLPAGEN